MKRITGTHPYCELFPPMDSKQFATLAESIRRGVTEPITIVVDEAGKILDGRHRKAAIDNIDQRITYSVETFKGNDAEKLAFVVARNFARRHLTTQQRAAIAAELATMTPGRPAKNASGEAVSSDDAPEPPEPTITQPQAADALNVSRSSVQRAAKLKQDDPEAFEEAKAGTLPRKPPARSKPAADPQTATASGTGPDDEPSSEPSAAETTASATTSKGSIDAQTTPPTVEPSTATVKPDAELRKLERRLHNTTTELDARFNDRARELCLDWLNRNGWQ